MVCTAVWLWYFCFDSQVRGVVRGYYIEVVSYSQVVHPGMENLRESMVIFPQPLQGEEEEVGQGGRESEGGQMAHLLQST